METLGAVLGFLWRHGLPATLTVAAAMLLGLLFGSLLVPLLYRQLDRLGWLPERPPLGPWLRALVVVIWCGLLPPGLALGGALVGSAYAVANLTEELHLAEKGTALALGGLARSLAVVADDDRDLPPEVTASLDYLSGEERIEIVAVAQLFTQLPGRLGTAAEEQAESLLHGEDEGIVRVVARRLLRGTIGWLAGSEAGERVAWIEPVIVELQARDAAAAGDGWVDLHQTLAAIAAVHVEPRLARSLFWFVLTQEILLIVGVAVAAVAVPLLARGVVRLTGPD